MARQVIHSGSFVGLHEIVWKVDIWEQVEEVDLGEEPGELNFPSEEPLVIEWSERGKEEVICGSSVTLKIESPTDRAYVGLYAEKPGTFGIDIYKDSVLYWRGTLDTEQYEEPYERLDGYDVTLTFSDFGAMDRIKFDMNDNVPTLAYILADALTKAGLDGLFYAVVVIYKGYNTEFRGIPLTVNGLMKRLGEGSAGTNCYVVAPCAIDGSAKYVVVYIVLVCRTVWHELRGYNAILDNPYLQFATDSVLLTAFRNGDVYLCSVQRGLYQHLYVSSALHFIPYKSYPVVGNVVDCTMPTDQSCGLRFSIPVTKIFLACLCGQSVGYRLRFPVDANRNKTVSVGFF